MAYKNKYRITIGGGYNGVFPITIYWVELYKEGFLFGKWIKIKGFDSKSRAKEFINMM
jgi:hypothetical protein